MSKKHGFLLPGVLMAAFALFTLAVKTADVRPIGPMGTSVGFASLNKAAFDLLGVHLFWYAVTDWLGLAAIAVAFGFAAAGLCQWIRRRSILRVDADILALGAFYLVVIGAYALFETHIVNCRPILLGASPEASYPSSHTMIVLCILGTAMLQFSARIKNRAALLAANTACAAVCFVTVAGRLVSGVHWFTDIAGGILLASALASLYAAVCSRFQKKSRRKGKADALRFREASAFFV